MDGQRSDAFPRITVITACYNSQKTIARTIESVLAQSWPNVEYYVMDGLSTDGTVEIAESYRAAFAEKGYDYHIISERDGGFYHAQNKAVSLASGDIIGQINSDDWYEPDALEKVAAVYLDKDFDVFWADLRILKPSGNIIKRAKLSRFATTRHWNHPTCFYRATVAKENPYRLENVYDDLDHHLRLRRKGYRFEVLNEVLANFTFGGMSNEKSLKKAFRRLGYRNRCYRQNGYGLLYFLDGFFIEMAKYILG